MNLVLLGPPGAGKGTLAGLLKDSFGLLHIATGDLLREEMKNETELGLKAKSFMERGDLVDDEIVVKLVGNKIKEEVDRYTGFMFDGFPRNRAQAEILDDILEDIKRPIDKVFYMDATLENILFRVTGRRMAPKSGKVYHVTNRPPKVEGKCDISGEDLVQRPDDTKETVSKRMDVYLKKTLPIVDFYADKGILEKLDGNKDSEILYERIADLLNGKNEFHSN